MERIKEFFDQNELISYEIEQLLAQHLLSFLDEPKFLNIPLASAHRILANFITQHPTCNLIPIVDFIFKFMDEKNNDAALLFGLMPVNGSEEYLLQKIFSSKNPIEIIKWLSPFHFIYLYIRLKNLEEERSKSTYKYSELLPIIVEEEESENEQQPIVSTISEEDIYASSSDEIISKDVIVDLFPLYSPKAHKDDDFRCNKKVIKLNSSDVIRLLNLFEPTYENFENYLYPIFHSPFKGENILKIVLDWYSNGTEHENDKIIQYYNENFNIVKTNEWLFRIINVLNEKQKRIIREKYLCNTIDESQRFNTTSQICFTSLASERNYKKESGYGIRVGEFLTDLKQVVARIITVPPVFVVKERSIEYHRAQIKILNEKEFYSQLKSIKLGVYKEGKKTKEINALDVYSSGINSDFSLTF